MGCSSITWLWWPEELILGGPMGLTIGKKVLGKLPHEGTTQTATEPSKKAHVIVLEHP